MSAGDWDPECLERGSAHRICGARCPEEPNWVCSRAQGHLGRHESDNGGDWHDKPPIVPGPDPCESGACGMDHAPRK